MIGIQSNAELFVWFKDKDILKTIPGLEGVVALESLRTGKKSNTKRIILYLACTKCGIEGP